MKIRGWFFIICVFLVGSGYIFKNNTSSYDIKVDATVDKNRIHIYETLKFTILITGKFRKAPQVESFKIPQFKILNISRTYNFSISRGDIQAESKTIYFLKPISSGRFIIPSVSVKYKSKIYTTKPINIEVLPGEEKPQPQITPDEGILL